MRVVVAGTFGPIHDGHRRLLEYALRFGTDEVIVGLTSDRLAENTREEARPIPPIGERRAAVERAIRDLDRWDRSVRIETLEDPEGQATSTPSIDALVVSPETVRELEPINEGRRERGLDPLLGIVVPYVLAEDGERISSTRIVRGEIDEHGRSP